jgi:NADH:ubiquinone oxidoreductase subunit 4 (subunit M)
MEKPRLIVILGQTSTGKSDFAVSLAKRVNGEIISADSRQVYKGLNLLSGKITKKENESLKDLSFREWVILAPLVVAVFFMGFFPNFFLSKMDSSIQRFLVRAVPEQRAVVMGNEK